MQCPYRRRPSGRVLGAAAVSLLVLSACSAGGHAAAGTSPTTVGTSPTTAASGCGQRVAAGSSTLDLAIDGHVRVVVVHIPIGYTGRRRMALVLNLHGSGSTARQQEIFSGMDATADRDGFIVAYPQGLITSGSGFDWNVPGEPLAGGSRPPANAADDVVFLTDLVPALAARYCIDVRRVFATGVSGGGRMASQLACDSPSTFAAIAPVAGLRFPSPCPATRPVPIIAFHGTADPIDPYNGHGQAYWTYSVPTAAARWAAHEGCRARPRTSAGKGYTRTRYVGCAGRGSVELYSITGEGHEWPGGPTMPATITSVLGPQSDALDANATMWAFFQSVPR